MSPLSLTCEPPQKRDIPDRNLPPRRRILLVHPCDASLASAAAAARWSWLVSSCLRCEEQDPPIISLLFFEQMWWFKMLRLSERIRWWEVFSTLLMWWHHSDFLLLCDVGMCCELVWDKQTSSWEKKTFTNYIEENTIRRLVMLAGSTTSLMACLARAAEYLWRQEKEFLVRRVRWDESWRS